MKIAFCYSGNLRTYEHCVINHANLIDEADVYFSTWDKFIFSNSINDPWHSKIELNVPDSINEDYIIKKTPKNFNIKSIKIDNYNDLTLENAKSNPNYPENIKSLYYQYFKIKDCYDLVKNSGINYDYVVRIRPDITIDNIVFVEDKILFENNIWFNWEYNINKRSINEMIWISNMKLMDKSVTIYDNISSICDSLDNSAIYGESICFHNLKKVDILKDVKLHNFNYRVIR